MLYQYVRSSQLRTSSTSLSLCINDTDVELTVLIRILGVSAFAGIAVLTLYWPLNSMLAHRTVWIQKGVLAARDKRSGVLTEMIPSVRNTPGS